MKSTECRFITYPDIVKKQTHTLAIINATDSEIAEVEEFCRNSNRLYDIYLYNTNQDELMWLNAITDLTDDVLIRDTSSIILSDSIGALVYGDTRMIENPLMYLEDIDAY